MGLGIKASFCIINICQHLQVSLEQRQKFSKQELEKQLINNFGVFQWHSFIRKLLHTNLNKTCEIVTETHLDTHHTNIQTLCLFHLKRVEALISVSRKVKDRPFKKNYQVFLGKYETELDKRPAGAVHFHGKVIHGYTETSHENGSIVVQYLLHRERYLLEVNKEFEVELFFDTISFALAYSHDCSAGNISIFSFWESSSFVYCGALSRLPHYNEYHTLSILLSAKVMFPTIFLYNSWSKVLE